ncbi:unnamed protein product [Mytilus coruscus]|uniref:Uncharacterized protein n=1 Tax=Mytilus coruscus TaxID=42192 RepID=A0A6J8C0G2_MYTCO|nr:unnamed protein product [Mytilus coruscus]
MCNLTQETVGHWFDFVTSVDKSINVWKVRAGHRGQVTRLLKKFEDIEKNSDLDKDEVKLIADAIEQKQRTTVELNEKILDSTSDEDVAEEIQESDDNLTEIQTLSYQKAQLHGHVAQTIEGFALTNANYTTAVNLFNESFGQPHKIIHTYMIALMEMPIPSNSLQRLRSYGDNLEAYVRGLESKGQAQEMYGALYMGNFHLKFAQISHENMAATILLD